MRTVKTTSGATAVQIVWSSRRGSREIEHLGSAHDEAQLEALKAAARQKIAAGQQELDLGLQPAEGGPLPITSSKMSHLVDSLERAYRVLGLEEAAGGDEVFRQLVLARIIEPISKLDSGRVLEEAGVVRPAERCPGLVVLVEELTHTLKLNSNGLAYAVNGNAVRFLPADALGDTARPAARRPSPLSRPRGKH